MSNGERFARLFRGYTARYGRYDMEGGATPETKIAGKAKTVDRPITIQDYADHVAGKVGIGVIPLQGEPKAPGFVNFAAIDIDVYKAETQAARNLTHADVALTLLETPLIVTKSKSGGIHVWLFSEAGVSAKAATAYLQMKAAELGVAGTEVFPKQNERHSDEDVGNWINLPYFGDTRQAVIPHKSGSVVDFKSPTLEEFLDIAEATSKEVTDEWLEAHTKAPTNQRVTGDAKPRWLDGPPCLQALVAGFPERVSAIRKRFEKGEITQDQMDKQIAYTVPQLREGARDNTFLQVAIYLRRRLSPHDPDGPLTDEQKKQLLADLHDAHNTWGRAVFGREQWDDPEGRGPNVYGIASELDRIAKQAAKGKWGYSCTKEPLKGFCDRRKCYSRKFGVGTAPSDAAFVISGFTIVNTADKQYYMNVGEHRIHIPDVSSLLSQNEFSKIVTNSTNRVWPTMPDPKFKQMMDELLQKADVIEGPPDSDRNSIVLDALDEFVHMRKTDESKAIQFFSGRVLWSADNTTAMFKFDQFMAFLASKGLRYSSNQIAHMLVNEFDVEARGNTHIGNKQGRPYVVHLARLKELRESI